jgi:hypothetical protein
VTRSVTIGSRTRASAAFLVPLVIAFTVIALMRPAPRLSFDAARWRDPNRSGDRWRMLEGMRRELDSRRPTRAETLQILGERDADVGDGSITYRLGRFSSGVLLPSTRTGDVTIFFGPDGRYNGCEVHSDAI